MKYKVVYSIDGNFYSETIDVADELDYIDGAVAAMARVKACRDNNDYKDMTAQGV
jgi:hypothetical protein